VVRDVVIAEFCNYTLYFGNYCKTLNIMSLEAVNLLAVLVVVVSADYVVDDSGGLGRMFDGIGGLSGGGVSI